MQCPPNLLVSFSLCRVLFFSEGHQGIKPNPRQVDGVEVADGLDVRVATFAQPEPRDMQLVTQLRKRRKTNVVKGSPRGLVEGARVAAKKPLPKKRTRDRSAVMFGVVSRSEPPGFRMRCISRRNE